MDELDMAQHYAEQGLKQAIESRVRYEGKSLEYCEICGEPIPEGRRRAVPGCRKCVSCQERCE
ncbi:MAG: TraR/DksA C4-type zinc finger protein [Thermodesulfobacteriota bacterium]|nr:TraR/DksA C4-type zinc finger protein [Thermodesulfobacteriota bacterium]